MAGGITGCEPVIEGTCTVHWYVDVLKKYAVFSERARRREFWMFSLFNAIAIGVLAGIGLWVGKPAALVPYFLYVIAVLLPSLAVTACMTSAAPAGSR
jgi:uncharacterized membrane protein YhaH (DUF805 family)